VTYEELVLWLGRLVEEGRLGEAQMQDILEQRRVFDSERPRLELEYDGLAVGFIAGQLFAAESIDLLLDQTAENDERMLYFEPIGYRGW